MAVIPDRRGRLRGCAAVSGGDEETEHYAAEAEGVLGIGELSSAH